MTAIDSTPGTVGSPWDCLLPGELMDALAGPAPGGADWVARAEAVHSTISELFETLAWRNAENDADELASLQRVIDEAAAHLERMRTRSAAT